MVLSLLSLKELTFEDHVHGVVSLVSQRVGILRFVKHAFLDTFVLIRCYFTFVLPILQYCSPMSSSAFGRAFRDQSFLRCVIDVMLLHCVCCTRLIRTRIIVCSMRFHLLLSEFDILELRLLLISYSMKYQGVERPDLQGVSCRPRLVCRMTFHTLCLIPERQMGLKGAVNLWLLP